MKIDRRKLEVAMAQAGYNFIALSDAAGVSRTTLSYINCGKSCRADVGGKIARALSVDVEAILSTEEQ